MAESYGIPVLSEVPNPSDALYDEIVSRLGRDPQWDKQCLVMANRLAQETKLARGTVTRTLLRLVAEGVLEAHRGRGYRIVDASEPRRSTTVVSVTEFCHDASLEIVSVFDRDGCRVLPVEDLHEEADEAHADMAAHVAEKLNIGTQDQVLVVRRARSLRRVGERKPPHWAILETLYLIEKKVPRLQEELARVLEPLGTKRPATNFSLHRWMQSRGITLERSEYSLTVSSIHGRDARVWNALNPKPHHRSVDPFIRLEAVTYGRGRGPLLFTREHLVPDMFTLGVTGFRFRPGTLLDGTSARRAGG